MFSYLLGILIFRSETQSKESCRIDKMLKKNKSLILILSLFLLVSSVNYYYPKFQLAFAETYIQAHDWINSYGDSNFNDDKIKVLGDIQPGLGTVMQEIGRRFTAIFYAARAGNWDLANYELKELREIQEVGEITRPNRKDALISFEENFLGFDKDPQEGTLQNAINKKNFAEFNRSFKSAIAGCNGCHQSTGFSFIKYKLPAKSELPLQFFLNEQNQ